MGTQEGGDDRHVGLGPADEEVDLQGVVAAGTADQLRRPRAVGIFPVAGGLLEVRLRQPLQDLRQATFQIIAVKSFHILRVFSAR